MPDYDLSADEYEVMRTDQVRYGGTFGGFTSDLVLTNEQVILVRRGVFGRAKPAEYFPLRSIKVVQDRPQVFDRGDKLELQMPDRHELFWFYRKRHIKVWVRKISDLLVGDGETVRSGTDKALPGAEYLAEAARDTLDALKRPFRSGRSRDKIALACSSCAAPISGFAGRMVRCSSCGSQQKLVGEGG